jgi:hypothetical protein
VNLARNAYRADIVAVYFGALMIWNLDLDGAGAGLMALAVILGKSLVMAFAGLGLLSFLAWLSARTTLYVITSRRIVMKVGIALPIFFNIPYSQIESAALRLFRDGAGDIPVTLAAGRRIAYLHLWPHARPFHLAKPQPALRSIPDAAQVAEILREAMVSDAQTRLGKAGAQSQTTAPATQQPFPPGAVAA